MRPLVQLKSLIALIPILGIMSSLLAAPLTARADDKGGKKGDGIDIKVGDPIIIKDKKPSPPPKKKDQEQADSQ